MFDVYRAEANHWRYLVVSAGSAIPGQMDPAKWEWIMVANDVAGEIRDEIKLSGFSCFMSMAALDDGRIVSAAAAKEAGAQARVS
ncbi:hypothetical protein [Methylobacterium nigriterrae]|uniref:hypothetical protein n=1 Tax=Methylobacterium nigriterrae TaxID=3127512 RepID=UPI0030133361